MSEGAASDPAPAAMPAETRPNRPIQRIGRWLRAEPFISLVLAALIGFAGAYCAIGFRELYLAIQTIAFGTDADALIGEIGGLPAWQIVAAPTAGGLLVGLFYYFVMPGRHPQGVADAMESVAFRSGRMDWRAGLGAAFGSAASIGTGASVGREGPVIHLGASLASFVGARLALSRSQMVTLLGCGVAAAISASFNAPIAGVFFALEVVIGHYALSAFAPIVIASVTGAIIARIHFGDFPAFIIPDRAIVSFLEFPAFLLLGLASGLAAIVFLRSVEVTRGVVTKIPAPAWSKPAAGGLVVGLIALAFPNVLGVGYGTTDAALRELIPFWTLVALLIAKTAATAVSLGSGFGGGVFSPSLFMGAMLGGAFGIVAAGAFPELSSGHGVYTLVGMGAVAGCVLGAPISTTLIVFELTGDYAITIAVMVGVAVASPLTQALHGRSFFEWQLLNRGISIKGGRERGLLDAIHVGDLMTDKFVTVPSGSDMAQVRERLLRAPHGQLFVVDGEGRPDGTITLADLSSYAFDTSDDDRLTAGEVARRNPQVIRAGEKIDKALAQMLETGEEHLGVLEDANSGRLVGVVHEVDVTLAYNRALMEARREERGER